MIRVLPLAALALLLAACSSSAPAIESTPAPASAEVDGRAADWAGALQPVEKQPGLSVGVRDDGETMTVALVANTPEQALRLSRGVTFWFDGEGGTDRAFGVSFPLRPERGGRGQGRRALGGGEGPGAGGGDPSGGDPSGGDPSGGDPSGGDPSGGDPSGGDPGARLVRARERFNEGTGRMAVYRGGGGELQLAVGEVDGIEAEAEWTEAALVVELRVPVTGSGNGYAVGAAPGGTVGLGIETVDLPEGALDRAQRPRGRAGAGRGGRGGQGRAGGRQGQDGAPRQLQTETQWLRVQLSR